MRRRLRSRLPPTRRARLFRYPTTTLLHLLRESGKRCVVCAFEHALDEYRLPEQWEKSHFKWDWDTTAQGGDKGERGTRNGEHNQPKLLRTWFYGFCRDKTQQNIRRLSCWLPYSSSILLCSPSLLSTPTFKPDYLLYSLYCYACSTFFSRHYTNTHKSNS